MTDRDEALPDWAGMAVPSAEAVVTTGNPYRLVDTSDSSIGAVAEYLKDLQTTGRPATTQRSYAMALLRWFRFLCAIAS